MKFAICRTSEYRDEFKPCKEAYQIDSVRVDERTVADPAKLPGQDGKEWYSRGANHRVSKGHIFRDFPIKLWVVDIDSLEALVKFEKKYGELILGEKDWRSKDLLSLEIYDDYRE
jgi:hypothetical protein